MFRHYSASQQHILNKKCDTKLLLYGRRDKLSVQSNRHLGAACCDKCPKYVCQMLEQQKNLQKPGSANMANFKLDIANNNSSRFISSPNADLHLRNISFKSRNLLDRTFPLSLMQKLTVVFGWRHCLNQGH